jgi:uncharacterized phage protein (TIGR01671 family)
MCRGEHWVYGQPRHYARNPHTEKWTIYDPITGIETDIVEETLGQYTGLTDRNGTKIFEGDILSTNSTVLSKLIVHWFERCGGFFLSDSKDIDASSLTPIYSVNLYKYVVIGNIYDNPELLYECQR